MADIDFITDITGQFQISLGDNPQAVTGNRALLNRFEITFLTKTRRFREGDTLVVDNYGGDADKFINRPQVLNDIQGIAAAVETAVDQTVQSLLSDQPDTIPDTEKLDRAELLDVSVQNDVIVASIRVHPVEVESYEDLMFNLPIIRT